MNVLEERKWFCKHRHKIKCSFSSLNICFISLILCYPFLINLPVLKCKDRCFINNGWANRIGRKAGKQTNLKHVCENEVSRRQDRKLMVVSYTFSSFGRRPLVWSGISLLLVTFRDLFISNFVFLGGKTTHGIETSDHVHDHRTWKHLIKFGDWID